MDHIARLRSEVAITSHPAKLVKACEIQTVLHVACTGHSILQISGQSNLVIPIRRCRRKAR